MADLLDQALTDLAGMEAEEWASAIHKVDPDGALTVYERDLAESAFKAGLNAGAGWALNYMRTHLQKMGGAA